MKAERKTVKLPVFCKVIYGLAAVCLILYFLFVRIPSFADWFNRWISSAGRRILSFFTVLLPFSVAELLFLFLPVFLGIVIYRVIRIHSKSAAAVRVFFGRVAALICFVAILFVLCFAPGYYGSTLDKKLGLERAPVGAGELYQTALILTEKLNDLADGLTTLDSGSTIMPYTIAELNRKLAAAYENYTVDKSFPDHFYSRVKPLMISKLFSYAHITGVYTFFTGEANINVDFPDYCVPFTAAHELAHQRGVAREDEANFIAFLVCYCSDDAYLQYSGYLNLYEYVSNALYSADYELWKTAWANLDERVKSEERAYAVFFEQYRDNVIGTASEQVNDFYLRSQGAAAGTRSYNLVVDLAVAFFRCRFPAQTGKS